MNIIKIAHTGCGLKDNSWEFINKVVSTSADIVEVDINFTSDQEIILYHDQEIKFNEETVPVESLTYGEIQSIDDSIILLSDVIDKIISSDKLVNLDIKSTNSIPKLISFIKKNGYSANVIFTGCEEKRIQLIRSLDDELSIIYSPDESKYKNVSKDDLMKIGDFAIRNQCSGVNIDYKYIDHAFINQLNKRGLTSFVWTVNDKKDIIKMIHHGVTAITVNEFELIDYIDWVNRNNQKWLASLEGEK